MKHILVMLTVIVCRLMLLDPRRHCRHLSGMVNITLYDLIGLIDDLSLSGVASITLIEWQHLLGIAIKGMH